MTVRTLKINFAINVLGAIVPLIVALVTVPIYIRHIGDARYGVLSIVWVLLGYFGFLDLGLSRAAANALARLRDAPQESRARVLVTTLVLNLVLGVSGSLCLFFFGGYLLQHVVSVPEFLKSEVASAFPWVVGLFPLALVSGVGVGALESRERFLLANVLQVAGSSIGQIAPVILALAISPSLALVIPAAAISRGLTVFAVLLAVYQKEAPLSVSNFDKTEAKRLLGYGGWITVSGLIGPILVSIDQFVIGSVLGVAAVAHYAVPMNLVTRSQVFPSALVRTLFPRMSHSGPVEAQHLASRAFTSMVFGYAAICAPAIVIAPTFFRFWIGADFANIAAPVAEILFFGAWANAVAWVPYHLLQSQSRPDVAAKCHIMELLPFIAILWGLTSSFGIVGAAAAWTLRCAADAACLFWIAHMRRDALIRAIVPLGLLVGSALIANSIGTGLWEAIGAAMVVGAIAMILSLVMVDDLRNAAVTLSSHVARLLSPRPKSEPYTPDA
jgi:O-antigen/teichoic acid export membrane protein